MSISMLYKKYKKCTHIWGVSYNIFNKLYDFVDGPFVEYDAAICIVKNLHA